MWAGDAPGAPNFTDLVAAQHCLAGMHIYFIQMIVHADQALAVIDEDRVAVEKVVTGCQYGSIGRCQYGRALGRGDVQAAVGLARLIVEKPP